MSVLACLLAIVWKALAPVLDLGPGTQKGWCSVNWDLLDCPWLTEACGLGKERMKGRRVVVKLFIPGCPCGHPRNGAATVLRSVTKQGLSSWAVGIRKCILMRKRQNIQSLGHCYL